MNDGLGKFKNRTQNRDSYLRTSNYQKIKTLKVKKLVIVLVVIVFFVTLIIVLLFPKNKKDDNVTPVSYREKINYFSNYLLYGKNSIEDINEEYEWGRRYYARDLEVIYSDDYGDYLDGLMNRYNQIYEDDTNLFIEYNNIFLLFYYKNKYPDVSSFEEMLNEELHEDSEEDNSYVDIYSEQEKKQKIEQYYSPFLSSGNDFVKEYGQGRIDYLETGEMKNLYYPDVNIEVFKKIFPILKGAYETAE